MFASADARNRLKIATSQWESDQDLEMAPTARAQRAVEAMWYLPEGIRRLAEAALSLSPTGQQVCVEHDAEAKRTVMHRAWAVMLEPEHGVPSLKPHAGMDCSSASYWIDR